MSEPAFEMNIKGLEKLQKLLKDPLPIVRIGILGSSPRSPKAGQKASPSNATIGAVHEFGAPNRGIPQRSFLRVPIADHLDKRMESSGMFDDKLLKNVVDHGAEPFMLKLAVLAEGIVSDAFSTGGFGQWPAWKNPNYENNTGQLLIDSQQLRNSISTEVVT